MKLKHLFPTISTNYPVILEINETGQNYGLEIDEDYIDEFDKTEDTNQWYLKSLKILNNFETYYNLEVINISIEAVINTDETVTPTMFITVTQD